MSSRVNAILAVAAAAALMATAVGSASAGRLSLSSRTFRVTWTALEFAEPTFGVSIRCPVTFEGSFHSSTIAKVAGSLIGYITRAPLASSACTGGAGEGAALGNESLPWHIRYDGFAGTLPNITMVKLRILGKREPEIVRGFSCLYHPQIMGLPVELLIGAGGTITGFQFESEGILEKLMGGIQCPPIIRDIGLGRFTVLGTTTAVTLRLI
jgi:hypothetical protein